MKVNKRDASGSTIGYLYQCKVGLIQLIKKSRLGDEEYSISIENLDDLQIDSSTRTEDLIQVKHHFNASNLNNKNVDFWHTLEVWMEERDKTKNCSYFLLTTSVAQAGTISYFLKPDPELRDVDKAVELMNSEAQDIKNKVLDVPTTEFLKLNIEEQKEFIRRIYILDENPNIKEIDSALSRELITNVSEDLRKDYIDSIVGWWLQQIILCLSKSKKSISVGELFAKIYDLNDQFATSKLAADFKAYMPTEEEKEKVKDNTFIKQLKQISMTETAIGHAIRDYFRAYKQRLKWIRNDVLAEETIIEYEQVLVEEWERIKDVSERGKDLENSDVCIEVGQQIYDYLNQHDLPKIRDGFNHPYFARGTYQQLSNNVSVWWHPKFVEKIESLLKSEET